MMNKALPMEFSRASRNAASTAHQSGSNPSSSTNGGVTIYQTLPAGGSTQGGLGQSSSLALMNGSNSKSLIEQGAVAAVVPQTTSHAAQASSEKSGGGPLNSSGSSRAQVHHQSNNFLPTIAQSTGSQSNQNFSQAMYASASPYHSLDEQQQQQHSSSSANMPLQGLGSGAASNQFQSSSTLS